MKIEFIIVGVMKSGTTTLANYLFLHPQIAIPECEVGYFANDKYQKGKEWYESFISKYITPQTKIAGEKTPYSYLSYTAERIYQYNPEMKLIWILRNPVDRAYSNYTNDLFNIDEWRSFEECIKRENKRSYHNRYLEKGKYFAQITTFLQYFKKEQMHFIIFEEFINNLQQELDKISEFLKVEKINFSSGKQIEEKKSYSPKYNPAILFFYRKLLGNKGKIWDYLWKINFENRTKKKMNKKIREVLIEYYIPYNKMLESLLNKDLSFWNK